LSTKEAASSMKYECSLPAAGRGSAPPRQGLPPGAREALQPSGQPGPPVLAERQGRAGAGGRHLGIRGPARPPPRTGAPGRSRAPARASAARRPACRRGGGREGARRGWGRGGPTGPSWLRGSPRGSRRLVGPRKPAAAGCGAGQRAGHAHAREQALQLLGDAAVGLPPLGRPLC
jgi:hypothetical protein